jgi:hypothetical protein
MRRWVTALLVGAVLAGACGDDGDASTADATTTTAEGATTTTTEAAETDNGAEPVDGPTVELLDAGAEPRRELRLAPTEGDVVEVTLRQGQVFEVRADGHEERASTVHELDMAHEVVSVAGDEIEVAIRYQGGRVIEADEAVRPMLEDMVGRFDGLEASATFDRQGRIVAATTPDLDVSDMPELAGFLDSLGEQMASFTTPFPAEPVGVGAQWVVTSSADFAGVFGAETSVLITLTELTDDVAAADTELRMEMTSTTPGLTIETSDLGGTGTVRWVLDGVLSTSEQVVGGTLVMVTQGQRVEPAMEQTLSVTIR